MKRILFSAIAASVLLLSCSKDHDDFSPAKGKKLIYSDISHPTTFKYNADGSIREASYEDWGKIYKYVFTHEAGAVKYVLQNTASGNNAESGTYTIVNGKPATRNWWVHNASGEPVWNYKDKLEYNSQGLLWKYTYTDGLYHLHYYDANGDMIKKEAYNSQGVLISLTVFTYYDKVDKYPWYGVLNMWFLNYFVPPYSKHLVKSRTYTDMVNPGNYYETTYSYEFDADGYVVKGIEHNISHPQNPDFEWHNIYE